jgi:hypothetical protein
MQFRFKLKQSKEKANESKRVQLLSEIQNRNQGDYPFHDVGKINFNCLASITKPESQ